MEINPNFSENAKNDYNLVARAKTGEDYAYEELMHRYKDSIYFMALKMVNNKDDANDLMMETFGKAFENLEKYKPDYAFSTWLYRIATNNCIDFIRKKKVKQVSIDTAEDDEGGGSNHPMQIKSDTLNPEEMSIKKQKIERLKAIIEQLPQRYIILIKLRYFEEFSYDEISEQLDIPLGTVKAQLFRARELLSNIMNRRNNKLSGDF